MTVPLLKTKLFVPQFRPNHISRPHLVARLMQQPRRKLTLVSAPAGFGKSTLVSEWCSAEHAKKPSTPIAWFSIDPGDNDPQRFLSYFIGALQTVFPAVGAKTSPFLALPSPPPIETILTTLLNEIAVLEDGCLLVLDDFHQIDAVPVNRILTFMVEHCPPQLRLAIVSREDPPLPLARLRGRGHLTELRAADLRFSPVETTQFLNEVMGLTLSAENITALESRTEGWIAGLQLAAMSMQNHGDPSTFIDSFTGSHRFILDYLLEEVLQAQPSNRLNFLLQTAQFGRFCADLCDAVLDEPSGTSEDWLQQIEQTNLFVIPLDNERKWFRYHHLFGHLLKQKFQQTYSEKQKAALHKNASQWYEKNGEELEAFHQAALAQDYERANRLIEGNGMPLHFRGAVRPIFDWLKTLDHSVLNEYPNLWTTFASVALALGHSEENEFKLISAERALEKRPPSPEKQDQIGRIAAIRATYAVSINQIADVIEQSELALANLAPSNLSFRTSTAWKLGYAHRANGDRKRAAAAYTNVLKIGQRSGNKVFNLMALLGMGELQRINNQLHESAETFQRTIDLIGAAPIPMVGYAYSGLGHINYQWNNLAKARDYANKSFEALGHVNNGDLIISAHHLNAELDLAEENFSSALSHIGKTLANGLQGFSPDARSQLADCQIRIYLKQGDLASASAIVDQQEAYISHPRLHLAQNQPDKALSQLESLLENAKNKGWFDQQLQAYILLALTHQQLGNKDGAALALQHALTLAQPAGFIRIFLIEGEPLQRLLQYQPRLIGRMASYHANLLAAFAELNPSQPPSTPNQKLVDPLSPRELEILALVADGLSNREIGERLFLSLNTVKGHNRNIFGKLQVQRRTEAVARARELQLL